MKVFRSIVTQNCVFAFGCSNKVEAGRLRKMKPLSLFFENERRKQDPILPEEEKDIDKYCHTMNTQIDHRIEDDVLYIQGPSGKWYE